LVELLDPDVEWFQAEGHPYAGKGPWRGPAQVVEKVANPINEEWDGFLTYVDEYLECGPETVVVLGRYKGRYTKTGRTIDAPVCTVYTVRNGRIVTWRQYTDTAQIRAAMDQPYLLTDLDSK
jgi:ketosteroid isomerase-like protein